MRLRELRRGIAAALGWLGAVLLFVTLLPPRWYVRWLAGDWTDAPGGVLIVLGGDTLDGRMLGTSSYWRSVYATWAWREGTFRHLILSGAEATTLPMRDFIVCQGVPPAAITLEPRALSTRENALFTAGLARRFPGPYVLLTSDYHMRRASRAFRKAGLEVIPRPFPDALKRMNDWRDRWRIFLDLVQESVKAGYYWAHGWT
jgi:uncharacterized SAM-binding protein YcdF (DUF218 family)